MRLEYIHGKLTYIIDTLHCIDNRYKGSCYCLHKLAYELANLGNIVYIFNEPIYQHSNIKVIPCYSENFFNDNFIKSYRWDQFEFDIFKTVSVYTQITWGNPFGTHFNTRWLLHDCEDEKFNKYEYILTFDDKTYYTSIANLCGAKSIILNEDQNLSPTEYRLQNPTNMFGVSYGLNDIEWSRKTLHLVRDHLSELQKIDYKTVVNFNNYWYDKLSKT
jgi:hypothetical protein